MPHVYGIRDGLNLDNLDVTTEDEIDTFLTFARIGGHEYVYGQRFVRGPASGCIPARTSPSCICA